MHWERKGSACHPDRWGRALRHTFVFSGALVNCMKMFSLIKKKNTAHWSFCRHPCILPSATVSPSGTQKCWWWSCPSCIPVLERVPGWTSPQTNPFYLSPLSIFKSLCHHFEITKLHWIPQTIFCCRHCSGKDCVMHHLPAALSSLPKAFSTS